LYIIIIITRLLLFLPSSAHTKFSVHLADFRIPIPHRAGALPVSHRPLQYPPSSGAALGGAGLRVGSPWSSVAGLLLAPAAGRRNGHGAASRGRNRTTRAVSVDTAAQHVYARVDEPLRPVILLHVCNLVILVVPGARGLGGRPPQRRHDPALALHAGYAPAAMEGDRATARADDFEAVELLLAAYRRVVAAALVAALSRVTRTRA